MGKKQHQKDKMYLTHTEWATLYGGKAAALNSRPGAKGSFKRLPFDHCALSLQPFENPYCDKDGNIFDLLALLPFIKKFHINPVTGEKIDAKDLTKLTFHKSSTGEYQCPVLYRDFTPNSHIVAIKPTGNVFSYEAVETLNIKNKNWSELLTGEKFTRDDIITIQDPNNLKKFDLSQFHHLLQHLKCIDEDLEASKSSNIKNAGFLANDIIQALNESDVCLPEKKEDEAKKADAVNAAHYSTGKVAAGFTSTVMPVETKHEPATLDEDTIRYERIKKKGYVRLGTTHGMLNIELHCDLIPKACENFILLCKRKYYLGTRFHRSIKYFMIQGGDPTGKGTGGESAWGKPFEDEFKARLSHEGRGVLSMANTGPNTNGSQFFITFKSCKYLDKKHTIFGKIVGGLETLSTMEKVETDKDDVPIEDIKITSIDVFQDPYEEVDAQLAAERAKVAEEEEAKKKPKKKEEKFKAYGTGVGKYINFKSRPIDTDAGGSSAKKKKVEGKFTNFESW